MKATMTNNLRFHSSLRSKLMQHQNKVETSATTRLPRGEVAETVFENHRGLRLSAKRLSEQRIGDCSIRAHE